MPKLINVTNLKTSFDTRDGEVESVRGVSLSIKEGEIVGIVGESGSGKSVTAKSLLKLIQSPGRIKSGEVMFDDQDILTLSEKKLRSIRGKDIAMIFQDPMTSLNPVVKIGKQMIEVVRRHRGVSKIAGQKIVTELLHQVGITSPEARLEQYPHELSGGMRQRVMIAMAISSEPKLLIADEPTTALDVTIQAQILKLMQELQEKTGTSILLITHDLGVVAQICTRVIVMYGGLIMEEGTVEEIFYSPQHPYTKGLLRSIPNPISGNKERLVPIEGTPPNLLNPPTGCPFKERCQIATEKCNEMPLYKYANERHRSLCWFSDEGEATNDA